MNDKFQLWSPPKLDLSLDSFSDDLIQQFDSKRHQNVTTVTPPEPNPEREVMETMIASPKQQLQQQDFLPHSPVSSSLPSEQDIARQEEQKETVVQEEEEEDQEDQEEEEEQEQEIEEEEVEEQEVEENDDTELNAEKNKEQVNNHEEEEEQEKVSLRPSSSLSKKKASVEEEKPSDEVISAVSSKVAPPDIRAVSVPEPPTATPKRRSFFSFRFC